MLKSHYVILNILLPGDPLRETLSSVILKLTDDQVLLEHYNKWWKVENNKCKLDSGGGGNKVLSLKNLGKC